ncbi:hypothetical protein Lalb_Chr23g0269291 [Lupinus albus]|uniref:Uncharacterized protein n=1 Tax=Lupinus albus TaxID=3870 RepID=A0A6A4NAV7_LUPAL|nr:hypothetical protein Lalb_Chr23g0269291 [Lupinus albus]
MSLIGYITPLFFSLIIIQLTFLFLIHLFNKVRLLGRMNLPTNFYLSFITVFLNKFLDNKPKGFLTDDSDDSDDIDCDPDVDTLY